MPSNDPRADEGSHDTAETGSDAAPLIVTAHLDAISFEELDALRRRHFPRARNRIPAHISLFHKLPGREVERVRDTLRETCRAVAAFAVAPVELRFLGRGVAIGYEAPELVRIHAQLARIWDGWLSAQDRQPFRAHVTVQNKVEPAAARTLLAALREEAEPPTCRVEGLTLWRYRGGPWDRVETVPFGAPTA